MLLISTPASAYEYYYGGQAVSDAKQHIHVSIDTFDKQRNGDLRFVERNSYRILYENWELEIQKLRERDITWTTYLTAKLGKSIKYRNERLEDYYYQEGGRWELDQ